MISEAEATGKGGTHVVGGKGVIEEASMEARRQSSTNTRNYIAVVLSC